MTNIFKNKKVVLPVIHVETEEQAMRNVQIARECGAHGVFIISHGSLYGKELFELALKIKQQFDGFWVGVNCLDLSPLDVINQMPLEIDGVWSDNARIDERADTQEYPLQVKEAIKTRGWNGMYFGGVAFKYQREVKDLKTAVEKSMLFMDVICTSGIGTGHAADPGKIRKMKSAAGDFPIAVASGITPENVTKYLPYVDYFLVATGIGKSFTELDEEKLKKLIKNARHVDYQEADTVK